MNRSPVTPKRIAIIGGGISGLAAAYHLAEARRAGAPIEEFLFEAGPRLGGSLRTESIEGCTIEAGADSFLTEKPEAIELCTQLRLGDQLVGSNDRQRKTWILHCGELTPLPEGFEFLVPTRTLAVLRTPLLSLRDKLALAMEIFSRPLKSPVDESVAAFVERHFSRGLAETIVEPLLAAVYGGDPRILSVQSVLPRYVEIERKWGSLVRGVRRAAKDRTKRATGGRDARRPLFTTLRGGLGSLVEALHARLEEARVRCGQRATGLARASDAESPGRYSVRFDDNDSFEAEAVVLALPAYEAARLLRPLDNHLAGVLDAIPYSSSMIVVTGYDARIEKNIPPGFGFLVPREEPVRVRACTFLNQKFPDRVPPERMVMRCFLGGMKDESVMELSDSEAYATVRRDLQNILGISAEPVFQRTYRWHRAMAQYTVGHEERLRIIRAQLALQPGLRLCGNAYEGIGVSDCIRSGRKAAEACLNLLQSQG